MRTADQRIEDAKQGPQDPHAMHDEAMGLVAKAEIAKGRGHVGSQRQYLLEALDLELAAAKICTEETKARLFASVQEIVARYNATLNPDEGK